MIRTADILRAAIIAGATAIVGLFLFMGSTHAGGIPFFAGMVAIPPLFLIYKDWLSFDSLLIAVAVTLVLHFILWLLIVVVFSRLRELWRES